MGNGAYFILSLFFEKIIRINAEKKHGLGYVKIYFKEEIGGKNVSFCINLLYVLFSESENYKDSKRQTE